MTKLSGFETSCMEDEKKRVMDEVRHCEDGTTSFEAYMPCYENTARSSGRRAKACLA